MGTMKKYKWQSMVGFLYPSHASILDKLIKKYVNEETICLEIGVFCGKSLMHLLEIGKPKYVYAIDPFEGQPTQDISYGEIDLRIDYANQYQYNKVIKHFKDFDNLTIIKGYSPLPDLELPRIGYAFIDGNHGYKEVLADADWVYTLMDKGVIVFDDYEKEGTSQAVSEFCEKNCLELEVSDCGEIAWIDIQ